MDPTATISGKSTNATKLVLQLEIKAQTKSVIKLEVFWI